MAGSVTRRVTHPYVSEGKAVQHAGMSVSPAVTTLCLLVWLPVFYYSIEASRILRQHGYHLGLLGARKHPASSPGSPPARG